MDNPRLTRIEVGTLNGKRPRSAGCNARLPVHGQLVREPIARLYFEDGSGGFGFSRVKLEQAQVLIGMPLDQLISVEAGVSEVARGIEFALWDTLGQRANTPVYRLLNGAPAEPLRVPCYDTTLYFDDLHLQDTQAAAALIAEEARAGYERGHRAFKLKVGRGALHLPLTEGTQRDIAIIRAVREAVGAGLPLMIDANNGWNVNLAKWVLSDTEDCQLYWLEEPFHEDRVLYEHLHGWMRAQGMSVLIADGEGHAAPDLLAWARDGVVDVIQYDLPSAGLSRWLEIGRQLDGWGVKSAPHNYGVAFGLYATCHLAPSLKHFTFAEWDQIDLEGLDASGYAIHEGKVSVPSAAGFGLRLDEATFAAALRDGGFVTA
ncbi:MAG TPA: enolase C-terminal domain-like protein [Phototrophicaceae bacterium]|nr:enolase C-terminal domain-like protein [Phototrophicaceae bacterium]